MEFRSRRGWMVFVAVCMSACGMDVRGQADDPFSIERLTLYGTCTSVGVVAKGETFDENGRVAHVVYYSDPAKPHGGRALQAGEIIQADELYQAGEVPAAQLDRLLKKLKPLTLSYFSYDELDRVVEERRHVAATEMPLQFQRTMVYDGDLLRPSITTSRNAEGKKTHENRRPAGGEYCSLYFDQLGEKVIYFNGLLPEDVDWSWGWGEAVDGVRCSVGVYQGHGELEKIRFAITALNESRTESVSLVDAYRPILTNDQGKAVPYRIDHSERDKRIIGGNGLLQTGRNFRLTSTGSVMSCNTGHGSIVRFDENLSDWYQNLSPGIYQLRIEMPYQDPGNFDLISPTVKIEITAAGDGIKSPDR